MISILALVEDSKDDQLLIQLAFQQARVKGEIVLLDDGEKALAYFEDAQQPLPVLILLDLNLPNIPGLEVLKRVRRNARTKECPVIVMTVTNAQQAIVDSYQFGVNGYMSKPIQPERLRITLAQIGLKWLLEDVQ